MILLGAVAAVAVLAAAGLASLTTAAVYRRRVDDATERVDAALADADALAESLQGLQIALEFGFEVAPSEISWRMPRTEALTLAATARDMRGPLRARRFRRFAAAHRGADLPKT